MTGHATAGTRDLPRAAHFYEALPGPLGATEMCRSPTGVGPGVARDQFMLAAMLPFDGQPATAGNGTTMGLMVTTTAQVDEVYHREVALGARAEGPAGPRGHGFYAGYFRNLDGNKLNVICHA